MKDSFTLIELLLSIAIVAIISSFSFSFYTRFLTQSSLSNTVNQLTGSLRKAQTYSMSGKQGSSWGVNYSNQTLTMFKGTSFGQDHSFDEVYNVVNSITVDGFSEKYFNRATGIPSQTATITVTGNNEIKTIVINEQGVVSK